VISARGSGARGDEWSAPEMHQRTPSRPRCSAQIACEVENSRQTAQNTQKPDIT